MAGSTKIKKPKVSSSRRGKNESALEALATACKKPGRKTHFQGFRLEFLDSIFPIYLSKIAKGESYWAEAKALFWARFSWRDWDLAVEANEDSYRNTSVLPDPDGSLTLEEQAEKTRVMTLIDRVRCNILLPAFLY